MTMALTEEQAAMAKTQTAVCEFGCQCCVFMFNVMAFGIWAQLGSMYVVHPYSQCVPFTRSFNGGEEDCALIVEPEKASSIFTSKVYDKKYILEDGPTTEEYLVVVADDVKQDFYGVEDTKLEYWPSGYVKSGVRPTDEWYGLEEYSPGAMVAVMVLVACTGLAMRLFAKAVSTDEDTSKLWRKIAHYFFKAQTTALAGSLSTVTCEEATPGVWESSMTQTVLVLWICTAAIPYFTLGGWCAGYPRVGLFPSIFTFFFSIHIIVKTTDSPGWAISKIIFGAGNDCLVHGSAAVAGVRVCNIMAFVCGIFQQVAAALSSLLDGVEQRLQEQRQRQRKLQELAGETQVVGSKI